MARHPEHASYFSETEFSQQRKAVVNLFEAVKPKLNQPEELEETFSKLSRIHGDHETPSEAYEDMGSVTIDLLAQYAGEKWNSKLDRVWEKLWQLISDEITQR